MLRRIAFGVFVLCLTFWCLLALVLCMTFLTQGWSGIVPKLIHLAGMTPDYHDRSLSFVTSRLVGLLVVTIGTGYFARFKQPVVDNS